MSGEMSAFYSLISTGIQNFNRPQRFWFSTSWTRERENSHHQGHGQARFSAGDGIHESKPLLPLNCPLMMEERVLSLSRLRSPVHCPTFWLHPGKLLPGLITLVGCSSNT